MEYEKKIHKAIVWGENEDYVSRIPEKVVDNIVSIVFGDDSSKPEGTEIIAKEQYRHLKDRLQSHRLAMNVDYFDRYKSLRDESDADFEFIVARQFIYDLLNEALLVRKLTYNGKTVTLDEDLTDYI